MIGERWVSVTVVDHNGAVVPDVQVTLHPDEGVPDRQITNANGRVTFKTMATGGANLQVQRVVTLSSERRIIPPMSCDEWVDPDSGAGWPAQLRFGAVEPAPIGPLPATPTREQVCSIRTSLQGLMYHTAQYGDIPAGFFWWLLEDRHVSVYPAHRAAGDTHLPISLSSSYREPGTLWPAALTNGEDFSQNLPRFKSLLREIISEGFYPDIPLAGDGESTGNGYNDPVGSTYGYDWLIANLSRVLTAIRGDAGSACPDGEDLTPFCIFRPGWDAVFYGWEPSREKLRRFGDLFRSILPNGYLSIEHNTGHIPAGEGLGDWQPGGCMTGYDTLLTEFDAPLAHNDNIWQIAGRTLGPAYTRPADQPAADDPTPPWYLGSGSHRGPYFVVAYEYDTYHWCRGRISLAQVEADRAYLRSVGYSLVG